MIDRSACDTVPEMRILIVVLLLAVASCSTVNMRSVGYGLLGGGLGGAATYSAGTGYAIARAPNDSDTSLAKESIGIAWAAGALIAGIGVVLVWSESRDKPSPTR